MKRKIAVIGSVGVPANYGGFETLVENLIGCDDFDFTVYCSRKHYSKRYQVYKNARLVYIPLDANGPMSLLYDTTSVLHGILSGHNRFLILGVSGALIIPIVSLLFPSIKFFTNIDGVEWRRAKWSGLAKRFLKFSERLAVNFSTAVIADNEAIASYVTETYGKNCITIPYGGDDGLESDSGADIVPIKLPFLNDYCLSLCRIEPENNVHLILEVFSESKENLVFIGNWDSSDYGRSLLAKYGHFHNLCLMPPTYDPQMLAGFRRSCSLYIHGHSAGGTNPSLVEMMHYCKPIVAYDCSFNRATMENRGSYFSNAGHLVDLLGNIAALEDGAALCEIAQRKYTWDIVRKQYVKLFLTFG